MQKLIRIYQFTWSSYLTWKYIDSKHCRICTHFTQYNFAVSQTIHFTFHSVKIERIQSFPLSIFSHTRTEYGDLRRQYTEKCRPERTRYSETLHALFAFYQRSLKLYLNVYLYSQVQIQITEIG